MDSILEAILWVILAISPIAILVALRMIFSKPEKKSSVSKKKRLPVLPSIPPIPQTYSHPTSSYKPVRTNYIPPSSTLHRVPDGYSDFVDKIITYSVISSLVDKEEGTLCTMNNEDNYKQTEDSCSSNTYDNDCSYSDSSSDSSSCSSD